MRHTFLNDLAVVALVTLATLAPVLLLGLITTHIV